LTDTGIAIDAEAVIIDAEAVVIDAEKSSSTKDEPTGSTESPRDCPFALAKEKAQTVLSQRPTSVDLHARQTSQ